MNRKDIRIMIVVFMLLAIGLYFIAGTYAKYTSSATGTGSINIAKWAVKINDKDLSQENTFNLNFNEVANDNVLDGKIAPASQLYADFVIDPAGSEVAVDYSFTLGQITIASGTVPTGISILKVVPVTGTTEGDPLVASQGKYSGTIALPKNDGKQLAALTSNEKVTMRVYVQWTHSDEANATDTTSGIAASALSMTVNTTVSQHI